MTFFERIASVPQLREAFERVKRNEGGCGFDNVTIDEFDVDLGANIERLSLHLKNNIYRPVPLLRVSIPKKNGKLRWLSIPSVRDRTAQTSASIVLTPVLDAGFEDCSFAYRKERSIQKAAKRISELREKGYQWVVDADINSFFDEVDHNLLVEMLKLYVDDTRVIDLVCLWLKCDIFFNGRTEKNAKGIPQGSPISPLLSNLYLDGFDETILGAKHKLVRFADDFVVLCKDRDDAQEALELTEAALGKLKLSLNEEKTRITNFDHGFRYLGYEFLRSMIFRPEEEDEPDVPFISAPANTPVTLKETFEISSGGEKINDDVPIKEHLPAEGTIDDDDADDGLEPTANNDPFLRTLYLVEQGVVLGKEDEHFRILRKGEVILEIPAFKVDQVMVFGHVQITTQAMEFCLLKDIPVILLSAAGRYFGTVESFRSMKVSLHCRQIETCSDLKKSLMVAKEMIRAKISNSKVVIQRYARKRPHLSFDEQLTAIKNLSGQIPSATSREQLMGIEGAASAAYFSAMRVLIGKEWGFTKRQKHPPPDPVNSLLGFGYTLLFYNIYAIVRMHGLHPYVGFLHGMRDGHPSLISDIMEEFRANVVDAIILNLILRRMITPDDFSMTEGERPSCLIGRDARRLFIRSFEAKMNSEMRHTATGFNVDYRRCIDLQVQAIKRVVDGAKDSYHPFLVK